MNHSAAEPFESSRSPRQPAIIHRIGTMALKASPRATLSGSRNSSRKYSTFSSRSCAKLIFDSRQNQAIDRERKRARRRGRGTTLRISAVDQASVAQGRRQGDAEGGERERGGGARGRAQQEAL